LDDESPPAAAVITSNTNSRARGIEETRRFRQMEVVAHGIRSFDSAPHVEFRRTMA